MKKPAGEDKMPQLKIEWLAPETSTSWLPARGAHVSHPRNLSVFPIFDH
jgi:hypothetical protein